MSGKIIRTFLADTSFNRRDECLVSQLLLGAKPLMYRVIDVNIIYWKEKKTVTCNSEIKTSVMYRGMRLKLKTCI